MSSNFKSWLLLAVIFVLGIVTGSALTIGLASHFMHPPGEQQREHHWMAHLTKRLSLTVDQQAKIQPILTEAENKLQALHRDEVEGGSQIFKGANDQIAALLTPEQKVELQKMESEREKMLPGHPHPWGTPPGGSDGMHAHGGPEPGMMPPPPPPLPPPPPPSDAPTNRPPPNP